MYDGDDAGVYLGRESAFLAILWPSLVRRGRISTVVTMRDPDESAPHAEDKGDLSYRVGDFGSAIEQTIRACDQQVAEDQRQAFEQIQSVALNSAETLATTCPKKLPEEHRYPNSVVNTSTSFPYDRLARSRIDHALGFRLELGQRLPAQVADQPATWEEV